MTRRSFDRFRSLVRPSRIGFRLLAFNLLVVFLPAAGILYLDVYETQLLVAQERGMVQQARLVAAALGGRSELSAMDARALVTRLGGRSDSRIRVYDASGALLADSAALQMPVEPEYDREQAAGRSSIRDRAMYRLGVWLVRMRATAGKVLSGVVEQFRDASESRRNDPADVEMRAALDGRYGAAVRPTPGQRSLTLSSAVPVRDGATVVGAAVVSQSTWRILQALYVVRLRVFEIVLVSLVAAGVLSVVLSATIVRPIVRLQRAALVHEMPGRHPGFPGLQRRDEVGDLARALESLTGRLDAHIRLLESFAADVSHEFRNPLASLRSASELIAASDDPEERARFAAMLIRDVDRLERLVAGVRELARIDAQLSHEQVEDVDVVALLREIAAGMQLTGTATRFAIAHVPELLVVRGARDRLAQVFENILHNAQGFAPDGTSVDVGAERDRNKCRIRICDRGPGIPAAHLDRVFDRFFTYRPAEGRGQHSGLGLAIARAIVEGYGGRIAASNRDGGGACFEITLPLSVP